MKWIIAICVVVLLTGCENGVTALVYCDENGRIIPNTPINSKYNVGKHTKSSIVLQ